MMRDIVEAVAEGLDPTPIIMTFMMLAIGYVMFDMPIILPSRIEEVNE